MSYIFCSYADGVANFYMYNNKQLFLKLFLRLQAKSQAIVLYAIFCKWALQRNERDEFIIDHIGETTILVTSDKR